jgi:enoyl-[acyl-carrier-protein] reductase (NADH)
MVGAGARHILLVSRSGSVTGKVKDLVEELAAVGAITIVRRCNVASRSEVDSLVKNQLEGLPPVRGVVHGTMVLRVSFVYTPRSPTITNGSRMFCTRR